MFPSRVMSIACPRCGATFAAQVQSIVDVGQDPEAKSKLLQGRLNVATCPHCGASGMLNIPLLYHDPDKELLLCFLPQGLNMGGDDQQRLIGALTNTLLSSLPPEKRKGYLLQPKVFFSLESMMEEIVRADGITQEALEARQAKVALIQRLLEATSDDVLRILVRENDEKLDYEFFELLTILIEAADLSGQTARAEQLRALRAKLMNMSSFGKVNRARQEITEALEKGMTQEEFLERVIRCQDDAELRGLIEAGRHMLDYQFFRRLTARIEAAEGQEAQRLRELRSRIMDIRDELDAEVRAAMEQTVALLWKIWHSEDRERAVREHLGEIDDVFFAILSANIQQAEAEGETEVAEELRKLGDIALRALRESAPPEIKLINRLLKAKYPKGTERILKENRDRVNEGLLRTMALLIEDLQQDGEVETAQRLTKIKEQATAILESAAVKPAIEGLHLPFA